ncbi:MAG: efflux RND transporter permease subunit [Gammaproteobacteria bacterium]|nr:efflux RND transporter permease subunit [Gammaproteobacteria bacterium]
MKIVDFATRRRVTILMFTVAVMVFGFVSQDRLSVNLLPELSYPTITVRTELTGAAPQEIENLITKPIEEAVGIIKGVRRVTSVSRTGQSDVTLEFAWGTDMDFAGVDIRDRLDILTLPLDAEQPVLLRFDPSSDPVLRYGFAVKSDQSSDISPEDRLKQLRRYADEQLKKDLESIDGVAAVKISGGLEDEIQVLVDQTRLAQLQIPIETVAARLRAENVNLSGGRLEDGNQEYLVRTINEFTSIEEMQNAIITTTDDRTIYLRDIATVRQGYKEREAITRINGEEAVEVALYKEGDANTVKVAEDVARRVASVKRKLPEQYDLTKVYDQSVFISQAISEVVNAAVIGGLLAALVIFFFLRNIWATLIISVSIPVSVIATFIMMYFNSVSLNIMSLGGIALAVGMLVDNAIVVLENIARHRGMGKDNEKAAREGTSEVGMAIFASTLTTIAVFFPLVFVQGIAGQLFSDQSLTVTFALAFSLVVALTLIPMLSAIRTRPLSEVEQDQALHPVTGLWQAHRQERGFGRWIRLPFRLVGMFFAGVIYLLFKLLLSAWRLLVVIIGIPMRYPVAGFQRYYQRMDDGYPGLLRWALNNRFTVLGTAFTTFAVSIAMIPMLGVELIPQLSQGEYHAEVKLPPGSPLEETDAVMQRLGAAAREQQQIATTYSVAGTGNRLDASPIDAGENAGKLNVVLKGALGPEQEEASIDQLRRVLNTVPGLEYKFGRPALFTFDTPLEIEISGYDIDQLKRTSDALVRRMGENDRFSDIKNTLQIGAPEVQINFDHERAAQLGLNVSDIANRIVTKIRGDVATRYTWRDRKIDVLIRTQEDQRASVDEISRLIVNPQSARPVSLSAVADIEVGLGPSEIRRANQQRIALITANLGYGDLGAAVTEVNAILDDMAIPPQLTATVTGQSEDMKIAFESMQFALLLAIFLVYLVMASQFESLLHPFVILFTIPLALTGAIFALLLTNSTISVVVFIGLIMLAGIVVNNAIVLVDMINQLRLGGMDKVSAIIEAGHARLRPIIMTTLTTALGLLPMAIGLGEGSEIRTPMAITVIGGLVFSTLLTLVVIPVMYAVIDRKRILPERQA